MDGRGLDLSSATERRPLADPAEAFSGARLERVRLADGRRLVLKHLPAGGDWLTRVTDGAGRVRRLWESGLLDRVRPFADHAVIDVRTIDEHDVVIMRDASEELLPGGTPISRDVSRALLGRLAVMHDAFEGGPVDELCPLAARYQMFAPQIHATDTGPGRHPIADRIVRGWELFDQHVDADAVATVSTIHDDPERLARRLADGAPTLLHGDAKPENLGIADDELVAIDWGELTGYGPREVDVAWYALKASPRIGCTPDEVFAEYEEAAGRSLDPELLDLTAIGSLAQMGLRFALSAYDTGPDPPAAASEQLRWWTTRVHTALDRLGGI